MWGSPSYLDLISELSSRPDCWVRLGGELSAELCVGLDNTRHTAQTPGGLRATAESKISRYMKIWRYEDMNIQLAVMTCSLSCQLNINNFSEVLKSEECWRFKYRLRVPCSCKFTLKTINLIVDTPDDGRPLSPCLLVMRRGRWRRWRMFYCDLSWGRASLTTLQSPVSWLLLSLTDRYGPVKIFSLQNYQIFLHHGRQEKY